MARDATTGVCVMRLTAGLDSGPVALRAEVPLGEDEDYGTLAPKLADLGGDLLVEALDLLGDGTLAFTEQDESGATYAEKIAAGGASAGPVPASAGPGGEGPGTDAAHRRVPGTGGWRATRGALGASGRRDGRPA